MTKGHAHDDSCCTNEWMGEGCADDARDKRPYIAVASQLHRHPKYKRMSKDARLHLLTLWQDCNEYRTNGVVDHDALHDEGPEVAQELIDWGWVHPIKGTSDYYCHDYLKHQKSRAQIESARAGKSSSGAAGAHVRWHVNEGKFEPTCALCVSESG